MSDIRAIIRELLAEEFAVLRAEMLGQQLPVERVAAGTEAELTAFALQVARRVRDEAGFLTALEGGQLRFAPLTPSVAAAPVAALPIMRAPSIDATTSIPLVAPALPSVPELRKGLITERDIAAISHEEKRLRILKNARMTPLAADETRRRGIRIERTLT